METKVRGTELEKNVDTTRALQSCCEWDSLLVLGHTGIIYANWSINWLRDISYITSVCETTVYLLSDVKKIVSNNYEIYFIEIPTYRYAFKKT